MLDELKELGLSVGEIKVYKALLNLGVSGLNMIQQKAGMERRNIYDILNKLIEKGFVSYIQEKGKRLYKCTDPRIILEKISDKESNLNSLKKSIPEIISAFNQAKPSVSAEIYRGFEALKNLHEEILNYKECFWIGGNSGVEKTPIAQWFKHWMTRRAENKIMMYDLVDAGTFLEGFESNNSKTYKKNYYEKQELPYKLRSPMVIVIFGNKVGQILWGEQPFAIVTESTEMKESFMKYFYYFWKDSW